VLQKLDDVASHVSTGKRELQICDDLADSCSTVHSLDDLSRATRKLDHPFGIQKNVSLLRRLPLKAEMAAYFEDAVIA